jgi:zinc/manganese transport system permease protein
MIEMLSIPFIQNALIISFILVGIHSYLGSHVVRRGIIFTDLALAQFAVLGSVFGRLIGYEEHSTMLYIISLSSALIASYLFSLIKFDRKDIPVEAMIGIGYAFASAATILVIVKNPESAEEIKNMLVGSILLVSMDTIIQTFILYLFIGAIHFIFKEKIYAVTQRTKITHPVFWDFVFYASLSIVVTSSVQIAGVLLVFSLLVIPAIVSLLLGNRIRQQLIYGWSFGLVAAFLGILFAFNFDFPAGPSIVVVLVIIMLPIYIWKIKR